MKLRSFIIMIACAFAAQGFAQQPIKEYAEKPNPVKTDPAAWAKVKGVKCFWGSTDVRYKKEVPPQISGNATTLNLTAWRGEHVSAQFAVWGDRNLSSLSFHVSPLTRVDGGSDIIANAGDMSGFVRYVMTDGLNKDGLGGCGVREDQSMFDSTLVADPIDQITQQLAVPACTTQCSGSAYPFRNR